jgi:hypothetical protein
MRQLRTLTALLITIAAATAGERPPKDWSALAARNPDAFPVVLDQLKVTRMLALNPYSDINKPPPSAVLFHEWMVMASAVPSDTTSGSDIVRSLRAMIDSPKDGVAACFEPRHGIVLSDGRLTFEVVLCLKCFRYVVYTPDGKMAWGGSFATGKDEAPTWTRAFAAANFESPYQ